MALDPDPNADTNPETTSTSNTNVNPNLCSGECDTCMMMKYNDEALRGKWVARKRCVGVTCGDGDNDDGQKDVRPPKLRRVKHQFSTVDDGEEEEERFEDYEVVDISDSELVWSGIEWRVWFLDWRGNEKGMLLVSGPSASAAEPEYPASFICQGIIHGHGR
ncbi:hypothetical protein K443DRAFT_6794 [Laccaria amethystina LaAM-08-1]|uniref:Uncharacterized protein n=1 Tax=Laccaria amethystina LaAM-08-1 TaxID=1095629 RepID=A0A0C9XJG8_9AGAR|nr:hypothetical protein K443DRAFT_6794 [Laccaria amethystina LaAM-08-1]